MARSTQIDYARAIAFMATRKAAAGQETFGVPRVSVDADNTVSEFAIAVRSELKGNGFRRMLMACLLDYCRERDGAVRAWLSPWDARTGVAVAVRYL